MSEIGVTLRIEKVGDKEAITSLNLLDAKGQQIVESIAGRTGKALGDVASAYTRAGTSGQKFFADMAKGYDQLAKAEATEARASQQQANAVESAGERIASRYGQSSVAIARSFEVIGRTGKETGRSLDTLISQASMIAFSFGAAGPIVGAVGIATAAIVEMFQRSSKEAKKSADAVIAEYRRIAEQSVLQQGRKAAELYSGDDLAPDGTPDALGIKGSRALAASLRARIAAGTATVTKYDRGPDPRVYTTMTDDATKAASKLAEVNKWLTANEALYNKIITKAIPRASALQAAEDLPGFVSDQQKEEADAAKRVRRAQDAAIKAFSDGVEARKKQFDTSVENMVATMSDADQAWLTGAERVERAARRDDEARRAADAKAEATREKADAKHPLDKTELFDIGLEIGDITKNNPIIQAQEELDKKIKELSNHVTSELSHTLGSGIVAGFEAAFSGKGILGAIDSLTATVLSGIGNMMEALGAQFIIFGGWVAKFVAHVATFDFAGQIEAGVGMIAAGATLKAIAGKFGSSSAYAGASSGGYGSRTGTTTIDRGVINPGSYSSTSAKTISPRSADTFVFYGPNDPGAVKWLDDVDRKRQQRGSLVPG